VITVTGDSEDSHGLFLLGLLCSYVAEIRGA